MVTKLLTPELKDGYVSPEEKEAERKANIAKREQKNSLTAQDNPDPPA